MLDESFLILFNGHHEDCEFTLPAGEFGTAWTVVLDTADVDAKPEEFAAGDEFELIHHSLVLLRRVEG